MGGFVDHLEIGCPPEGEQLRPRCQSMLGPNCKERDAMIDLGCFQQATSAHFAFPPLTELQLSQVIDRRCPELPGDDAAGMPSRIPVRPILAPEVAMPSESVNRLTADAAIAGATGIGCLAVRRRGRTKRCGQAGGLFPAQLPAPPFRGSAPGCERPGQPVGQKRMVAPVGFHGPPLRRRYEGLSQGVKQDTRREQCREAAFQARAGRSVSLLSPSRHACCDPLIRASGSERQPTGAGDGFESPLLLSAGKSACGQLLPERPSVPAGGRSRMLFAEPARIRIYPQGSSRVAGVPGECFNAGCLLRSCSFRSPKLGWPGGCSCPGPFLSAPEQMSAVLSKQALFEGPT